MITRHRGPGREFDMKGNSYELVVVIVVVIVVVVVVIVVVTVVVVVRTDGNDFNRWK